MVMSSFFSEGGALATIFFFFLLSLAIKHLIHTCLHPPHFGGWVGDGTWTKSRLGHMMDDLARWGGSRSWRVSWSFEGGFWEKIRWLAEIVLMKKEIGEYLKALKFARRVIEVPSSELMGPILSRLVGQPRESISGSWSFSLPSVAIRSRANIAWVHSFFGHLDLEEETKSGSPSLNDWMSHATLAGCDLHENRRFWKIRRLFGDGGNSAGDLQSTGECVALQWIC
jgi:hypothetical protein